MAKGRFIKVECPGCGGKQVVFDKPASTVKCQSCEEVLVKPMGGKGKIIGKVLQELG
ncbi:MAG: 30S ribosomal protein S27e [archaeon]